VFITLYLDILSDPAHMLFLSSDYIQLVDAVNQK